MPAWHICRGYMEFAAWFGFAAAEHEAGVGQCHRAALAAVWLPEMPGSTGCSECVWGGISVQRLIFYWWSLELTAQVLSTLISGNLTMWFTKWVCCLFLTCSKMSLRILILGNIVSQHALNGIDKNSVYKTKLSDAVLSDEVDEAIIFVTKHLGCFC